MKKILLILALLFSTPSQAQDLTITEIIDLCEAKPLNCAAMLIWVSDEAKDLRNQNRYFKRLVRRLRKACGSRCVKVRSR